MKIYHDHDEDDSWTEITTIKEYPKITQRLNNTNQITFVLADFEGALYSTWSGYDFIPIKVEDDSSNVLFRGYLTGKRFSHNKLYCTVHGFSVKLDWIPLHKNFIKATGRIENVPSTTHVPVTWQVYPDGDDTQNWTVSAGTSHDAVATADDGIYITAGEVGDRGIEEIWDCGTLTVTSVSAIKVRIYGKYITTDYAITAQIWDDDGAAWEAAKSFDFTDDYSWVEQTWDGLAYDQGNMNALQLKIKANANYDAGDYTRIEAVELEVTYTGVSPEAIDVTDMDGEAIDFTADELHQNADYGILVRDDTANWSEVSFTATAVNVSNEHDSGGNAASMTNQNDANAYWIEDWNTLDADSVITLAGGSTIDSTTKTLKAIYIDYNISHRYWSTLSTIRKKHVLEIRFNEDDNDWREIWSATHTSNSANPTVYVPGTKSLSPGTSSANLAKYLKKTDDNWDGVEQIRIRMESDSTCGENDNQIIIDYLQCRVEYYEGDVVPIMEQITDNGTDWLLCDDVDFETNGVSGESAPGEVDGDVFSVGASTETVLEYLIGVCDVPINIESTTSKYIAQHYKGTYCKDVLNKICLLEGFHWWEDYDLGTIIIANEDDFVDSTVDLTQADYGYDWEFEDDCNYYGAVEVYGAAAFGVYYRVDSTTSTSKKVKTIIEETILTNAEAREVATAELAKIEAKQPSIKLSLYGVYTNLGIGKTVGLTMERPEVLEDDYPIRMIEREKFGGGIMTTVWCGLGQSTAAEKIADLINNGYRTARQAHTDRLVSTPFGAGATITWSDVGGADARALAAAVAGGLCTEAEAQAYVETQNLSLATTKTFGFDDGGSVNVIRDEDNMFSDDASALATQQSIKAYVDTYCSIGSSNAQWVPCLLVTGNKPQYDATGMIWDSGASRLFRNRSATDFNLVWLIPMPIIKGTKSLHVKDIRFGLADADANNEIDALYLRGYTDEDSYTTYYTWNGDGDAIATYELATDDGAWAGPYDLATAMSGYIVILITATNDANLEGTFLDVECYYG